MRQCRILLETFCFCPESPVMNWSMTSSKNSRYTLLFKVLSAINMGPKSSSLRISAQRSPKQTFYVKSLICLQNSYLFTSFLCFATSFKSGNFRQNYSSVFVSFLDNNEFYYLLTILMHQKVERKSVSVTERRENVSITACKHKYVHFSRTQLLYRDKCVDTDMLTEVEFKVDVSWRPFFVATFSFRTCFDKIYLVCQTIKNSLYQADTPYSGRGPPKIPTTRHDGGKELNSTLRS